MHGENAGMDGIKKDDAGVTMSLAVCVRRHSVPGKITQELRVK